MGETEWLFVPVKMFKINTRPGFNLADNISFIPLKTLEILQLSNSHYLQSLPWHKLNFSTRLIAISRQSYSN